MTSLGRRAKLLVLAAALASPLAAQQVPSGPQTALTASYTLNARDDRSGAWTSGQSALLGLTARWGQALGLEGQILAPFDATPLTADSLVRQLVLTWNVNAWSVVTFGKQRLSWGTARVFPAVDGLEPVYDPLHPQAVLDGVTGMKLEVLPTDWLSLSVLVLPAPALENSKRALRLDVLWEDTDLSAGAIHSVSGGLQRGDFYLDFARFADRFGFYGEAALKTFRDRDWVFTAGATNGGLKSPDLCWTPRATLGVQAEFPVWLNGTLRWLTEYHYNGQGFDASEAADFGRAWDRRHEAGVTAFTVPRDLSVATFSRHYGYTGVSGLPVTEKLSLGASVLGGLDTGFLLVRASAWYSVDQNLSAGLEYSRFDTWPGTSGNPSEKLLVPQVNQVSLTVTASY